VAEAAAPASSRAAVVVARAVVEAVAPAGLAPVLRGGAVAVLDDPKAARRARERGPASGRARRGTTAKGSRGRRERAAVKRGEHGGLKRLRHA
jgi:hypothetical protein